MKHCFDVLQIDRKADNYRDDGGPDTKTRSE